MSRINGRTEKATDAVIGGGYVVSSRSCERAANSG